MWIWYSDVSRVKCPALNFTGKYKGELLTPASQPSKPALRERTERAAENTEQMVTNERCSSAPQFSVSLKCTLWHLFCSSLRGQAH